MPYLRDRVIVLKREPYREHDRRYVMYGREYGLLSAVARGASSPRSKQAGHLEPFSEAEVMIAKGVAFDKLAVAKCVARRATSLSALTILGAFTDLVTRLTRPGISDDRLFDLLKEMVETLFALPTEPSTDRARFVFAAATLKFLDLLGFGPSIDVEDAQLGTILKFMRGATIQNVLRVTATRDVLQGASAFVEEAVKDTPLTEEPHGVRTIQAYLNLFPVVRVVS